MKQLVAAQDARERGNQFLFHQGQHAALVIGQAALAKLVVDHPQQRGNQAGELAAVLGPIEWAQGFLPWGTGRR